MTKKLLIIPLVALIAFSCFRDSSTKIENEIEVATNSENNVNEMIDHMGRIHNSCEGESITFRASAERAAIKIWDNKYPTEDVDKAIEELKETILSDTDIYNMKYGHFIIKVNRVIE